jgi:putative membrane protein
MRYYGYGDGGGHWVVWVLMIVAMVVFWGALAWIVVTLVRHRGTPPDSGTTPPNPWVPPPTSDGLRILNERLARGDIDEEEYTRRRALIEGTG